jgi:hypothetical protein
VCDYGSFKIIEEVNLTLPAGLADGEHAFGEAQPFAAVAAECNLALDDGFAERSFSGVARGLYSLGAEECPECRPEADEVTREGAGTAVLRCLSPGEEAAQASTERFYQEPELSEGEFILHVAAPGMKESLAFGDTSTADCCTSSTGIGHTLEVSREVSPAELAPLEWVAVVGTPAVGGNNSRWISTQECFPLAAGSTWSDPEVGGTGGDCSPHPASLVA